jgi:hypothetical protein
MSAAALNGPLFFACPGARLMEEYLTHNPSLFLVATAKVRMEQGIRILSSHYSVGEWFRLLTPLPRFPRRTAHASGET